MSAHPPAPAYTHSSCPLTSCLHALGLGPAPGLAGSAPPFVLAPAPPPNPPANPPTNPFPAPGPAGEAGTTTECGSAGCGPSSKAKLGRVGGELGSCACEVLVLVGPWEEELAVLVCPWDEELVVLVGADDAARARVCGETGRAGSHVYASVGCGSYSEPESAAARGGQCVVVSLTEEPLTDDEGGAVPDAVRVDGVVPGIIRRRVDGRARGTHLRRGPHMNCGARRSSSGAGRARMRARCHLAVRGRARGAARDRRTWRWGSMRGTRRA